MDNLESNLPKPLLAAALAKAQGEFPAIPKDSEVEVKSKEGKPLYRYKYADLTTIISHTRSSLSKNGLAFTQGVVPFGFATTLLHSSGESLVTGFIPIELPKGIEMKQLAGIVTYVKRISLTAALGVSADEDVDAAHDEGTQENTSTRKSIISEPAPTSPPKDRGPVQIRPKAVSESGLTRTELSGAQLARLFAIASERGWVHDEVRSYMHLRWNVKSTKDLTLEQYEELVSILETYNYSQAIQVQR